MKYDIIKIPNKSKRRKNVESSILLKQTYDLIETIENAENEQKKEEIFDRNFEQFIQFYFDIDAQISQYQYKDLKDEKIIKEVLCDIYKSLEKLKITSIEHENNILEGKEKLDSLLVEKEACLVRKNIY